MGFDIPIIRRNAILNQKQSPNVFFDEYFFK